MSSLETLMFEIKKQARGKKITQKKIASELNISRQTVSNILNLKTGSFNTLIKIIEFIENYPENK
jgi:transcriptional regulator with XRE-family HTH domain